MEARIIAAARPGSTRPAFRFVAEDQTGDRRRRTGQIHKHDCIRSGRQKDVILTLPLTRRAKYHRP
jgi:hypothetical protein